MSEARYLVTIWPHGSLQEVSPEHLTQTCDVEVIGLSERPELNKICGEILAFDMRDGRYHVHLRNQVDLKLLPGHALLRPGTRVKIRRPESFAGGSHGAAQVTADRSDLKLYQGQHARIVGIGRASATYSLRLERGQKLECGLDDVLC